MKQDRKGPAVIRPRDEIIALRRINKFLGTIHDIRRLLQMIMKEATVIVAAEASSIALLEAGTKKLHFFIALGKKTKGLKEIVLDLGEGIIGYAAKKRRTVLVPDVAKDPRFKRDADKKTGFKTRSILAVPIVHKGRLIGALEVINKRGRSKKFTKADAHILEIVAGQAGVAIENARLYQSIAEKHRDLRKKHRQLIDMQEKLLKMEKLSAIGDMASTITHDLKHHLAVISGYFDLLKDREIGQAEKDEYTSIITNEVKRMVGMTNEITDFAKGQHNLVFSECSMDEFVKEVCDFLRQNFKETGIRLSVEPGFRGKFISDRYKLERAIFNIAINARDAMPEGGDFRISTNRAGEDGIEIRLQDSGCGIPEEIKDRLFEPFVTSGKKHGTGLGLAIAKNIIECHNGTIKVESFRKEQYPDRHGTTFIIRIPVRPTL